MLFICDSISNKSAYMPKSKTVLAYGKMYKIHVSLPITSTILHLTFRLSIDLSVSRKIITAGKQSGLTICQVQRKYIQACPKNDSVLITVYTA